ncbi:FAD-binding oxidoreductase [Novosphingobium sp.]|uniref:FAD-binding oxidoreductase n=1 Tax=Novosphingobium sp. TaxID=1874826 RepID=UPI0025E74C14|nr:FAD-binding oxidoreductase [Novosphingobium sp.]
MPVITIDPGQFTNALAAFQDILGPGAVIEDSAQLADLGDPFAPPQGDWYKPGAVLLPASVEQVQAVLRIANEKKVPVWTNGQGRNNGYGGAAPRVSGSFVLSLKRMNRVLEVNEQSAYALVEPGVRFFDLYDHLRETGSKLWMSVPDLGWGSVIGNTLDHGVGYTPMGDHMNSQCGMEVVLANGDVLRTGLGGLTGAKGWHVYKHGCGPAIDGLFSQSNYGVVTKMGVQLMPAPECYMPGWLQLKNDSDLEVMLERLRPLMLNGTIPNQPMIINSACAMSAFTQRDAWYTGEGPLPQSVIDEICRQPMLGAWVMRFALYGDEQIVERQREIVSQALGTIDGATLTFSKYDGHNLPELDNPHERVQAGIPSLALDQMTRWYGGEKGGHIGFSSAMPITAADGAAIRDLVRGEVNAAGLDYSGVFIVGKRSMIHVCLVVFDTENAAQTETAYAVSKSMVKSAAKQGYGEYRSHLDFMDLVADQYDFNNHAQRRFHEVLKDALDPNGILSPGKQGIWPRVMRS